MKLLSFFMEEALEEAERAFKKGEVPVGSVVVLKGKIISKAHNRVEELKDPTAHAEILAIREAGKKVGIKNLKDCEIFITLEPCPMCAGAIALARFKKVYFGAWNYKHGAVVNRFFIFEEYKISWEKLECIKCEELLTTFFQSLRDTLK